MRTAASALQAGRYLYGGEQVRIEPDQWKREVEYWFAMGLARLQLEVFGTVEKPPGIDPGRAINIWEQPELRTLKALCGGIKFNSPKHTSISTLGLGIILGFSGLLILLSFTDAVALGFVHKRGKKLSAWEETETTRLLEMVQKTQKNESSGRYHVVGDGDNEATRMIQNCRTI
jgi:hypothetical protein